MASLFDFEMPTSTTYDAAGKEFDRWFDWNGATNHLDTSLADINGVKLPKQPVQLPISPSSTTHSESQSAARLAPSLTATSALDILTPSHSSSSPDARSSKEFRLSGDTLRESPPSNTRTRLKRKYSSNATPASPQQPDEPSQTAKKRPHNIIEKRYRANLNEKIAELRDSVPSLRTARKPKTKDGSNSDSDDGDLDGLAPSNKLNKASILTKAVEYIRHLEIRTRRLEDENRSLKERLETLDKVIARGGHDSQRATAFTSDTTIESPPIQASVDASPSLADGQGQSPKPAQGLIPLPESWRRFRQNQPQEHYGHIYDRPADRSPFRGKWPTRIMLGSLAGLMVLEGFAESDQGSSSREKGLFGIPLELLDGWKFLRSPRLYLSTFFQFCRAGGVIPLIKGFMALTILAFVVFAYLFNSKPSRKEDVEDDAVHSPQHPTPASPMEIRRRAWSTSMQILKLPHHAFFSEWFAVTSEWAKYTIRSLLGTAAYSWLTGRSVDDDAARIKAWDIAIDAQLAGGDVEVSRSRVVLTSFGSGTLPRTPLRLMLKALHCRLVLWNVGPSGTLPRQWSKATAKFFANREWRRARRLHDSMSLFDADRLPNHLAILLSLDCDDVFIDTVVQRAYNLMYDQPTQGGTEDLMMDVVVEDHAVKSPLDAVAAWRSTCALKQGLETSLHFVGQQNVLEEHLNLALKIAPPGSAAETRSFAAYSVFGSVNRRAFHARASQGFRKSVDTVPAVEPDNQLPVFIDSSTPASVRTDIENCLHCSHTLLRLDQGEALSEALEFFLSSSLEEKNATLLTVAALKHTCTRLPGLTTKNVLQVQGHQLSSRPADGEAGVVSSPIMVAADSPDMQHKMRYHQRRQSMVSNDTGYESDEDHVLMGMTAS